MDPLEPGGINVPDSVRIAAGKFITKDVPGSIEAWDLLASIDAVAKSGEAGVVSFLTNPGEWTRILVYSRPGEGPNITDPRLKNCIVVRKGTGINGFNQPCPMTDYTYVSDSIRPDGGIPWTSSVIVCPDNDSTKIKARALPHYQGYSPREKLIEVYTRMLSCWNAPDATVEVWKRGKSSRDEEKKKIGNPFTVLTPVPRPVAGS